MLYHLDAWLTRPPVPFVTAVPGFRYRSIPSERCAPLHGGVRRYEKSLRQSPVTLNLIQGLYRPSMALCVLAIRCKKSLQQSPVTLNLIQGLYRHPCALYLLPRKPPLPEPVEGTFFQKNVTCKRLGNILKQDYRAARK